MNVEKKNNDVQCGCGETCSHSCDENLAVLKASPEDQTAIFTDCTFRGCSFDLNDPIRDALPVTDEAPEGVDAVTVSSGYRFSGCTFDDCRFLYIPNTDPDDECEEEDDWGWEGECDDEDEDEDDDEGEHDHVCYDEQPAPEPPFMKKVNEVINRGSSSVNIFDAIDEHRSSERLMAFGKWLYEHDGAPTIPDDFETGLATILVDHALWKYAQTILVSVSTRNYTINSTIEKLALAYIACAYAFVADPTQVIGSATGIISEDKDRVGCYNELRFFDDLYKVMISRDGKERLLVIADQLRDTTKQLLSIFTSVDNMFRTKYGVIRDVVRIGAAMYEATIYSSVLHQIEIAKKGMGE